MVFDVHNCPRCELRFANRSEVEDHLRRDHTEAEMPGPQPTVPDPASHPRRHLMAMLDPDRPASPAAEVAAGLARRTGAVLELVSVSPADLPPHAVVAFLEAERRRMPDLDVVTCQLDGPEVVDALLGRIKERMPDLVILDSHGRTPIVETLLGSISADLVRSSPVPTLLVGPMCLPDTSAERFVVAFDGSADAAAALDVAMDLAPVLHLDIELVEVMTGELSDFGPPGDLSESAELRRLVRRLPRPVDSWDVLHGTDVSDALVDHVRGGTGGVLVLGTHGRSPGRPRVLGGVAAKTVRHSPVPVLVVSPEASVHHEESRREAPADRSMHA